MLMGQPRRKRKQEKKAESSPGVLLGPPRESLVCEFPHRAVVSAHGRSRAQGRAPITDTLHVEDISQPMP